MNAKPRQALAAGVAAAVLLSGCVPAVSNQPGKVIGKAHIDCRWVKILHEKYRNITKGCIDKARWDAVKIGDRWPPKTPASKGNR